MALLIALAETIYCYLNLCHIQATHSLVWWIKTCDPNQTWKGTLLNFSAKDSNVITTIHCVKKGWRLQLLGLLVNIWMKEEVHCLLCVFMSPAEQQERYTSKCVLRKFSKATAAQLHLLDAVCCYLVRLSVFVRFYGLCELRSSLLFAGCCLPAFLV